MNDYKGKDRRIVEILLVEGISIRIVRETKLFVLLVLHVETPISLERYTREVARKSNELRRGEPGRTARMDPHEIVG